jgi:hypothetical protein
MVQVVKCLPSKCTGSEFNPQYCLKKKKENCSLQVASKTGGLEPRKAVERGQEACWEEAGGGTCLR